MSKLQNIVRDLKKKYGDARVMLGSELDDVGVIPTGNPILDNLVFKIGGIPRGRIIELYGREASMKTTLSLLIAASLQREDPEAIVAVIDLERGLSASYLDRTDIDKSRFIRIRPETAMGALEQIEKLFETEEIKLIIIDSVAGIALDDEIRKNISKEFMAGAARVLSKFLKRSMYRNINKTTIIFINQIREKVGFVMGSPEITPGGRAIKHYASMRIRMGRPRPIEEGDNIIGKTVNIQLKKSKVCGEGGARDVNIYFNGGFDPINDVFNLALEWELINRRGSNYYIVVEESENILLGAGKAKSIDNLRENSELYETLLNEIKEYYQDEKSGGKNIECVYEEEQQESEISSGISSVILEMPDFEVDEKSPLDGKVDNF